MLGVDLGEHERRYDLGQEWIDLVTQSGRRRSPSISKANSSRPRNSAEPQTGQQFAPHGGLCGHGPGTNTPFNADMLFHTFYDFDKFRELRRAPAGRAIGRVSLFTNIGVVCRPTQKEAEEYHHYYAVEHADTEACRIMMVNGNRHRRDIRRERRTCMRAATANGAWWSATRTAHRLAKRRGRRRAVAIGLPNYLNDLPIVIDEVLPRLEARGLDSLRDSRLEGPGRTCHGGSCKR